jgi:Protein of unknown function (DUF2637)
VTGGRAIRWSTVLAVAGVALVAGWVSYVHAYDVVRAHGEHGILARLYPGTIDGLIYSASMVLLDAARRDVKPPPLARWLLVAGIGATLFANVLAGAAYGLLGAAVAAWPALALVGSYELLMWLVRHGVTAPAEAAGPVSLAVPNDAETAAMASLRATLAAGNPWSNNQLADRFGLTRAQATKVRQRVTTESDGSELEA